MKYIFLILLCIGMIPAYAYNSGFQPVYQPPAPPTGISSIHEIGNVTSTGCATNQYLSVNSTGFFVCTTLTGAGEANTMSSPTHAESLVLPKSGVDLPIKGIACGGSIICSSNSTDITLTYTATGGGNATNLNDLGDVVLTSPAYLSTLFYNGLQWIDKIFTINTTTCDSGKFVSAINNQTGAITCTTPTGSGNVTNINDAGDVVLTSPSPLSTLYYVGTQWVDKIFSVNTQSASTDVFVTGINNQTGAITTNQFSVNTKTCSGTDKISAINNVTGDVTCSTDSSSATARESLVGTWEVDKTWANIGTSFVNVFTTGTGDPFRIDTNGKTTVTLMIDWTKVGAGTQLCKIAQVGAENTILIMYSNLASGLNTNATVSIPVAQQNIIANYKPMCRSTTSTDDPVWLNGEVLLR